MNVRSLLEICAREAAALAGELSLLLQRDTITKRDVLRTLNRLNRLNALADRISEVTKLPRNPT